MIEHVYRRAEASPIVSQVIVATDDLRIAAAVTGFGGNVRLTRADHELRSSRRVDANRVSIAARAAKPRSVNRRRSESSSIPSTS